MYIPQGYKAATPQKEGEYLKLTEGGHVCKVIKATEEVRNDISYLVLSLDICEGSEFDDYYSKKFESSTNTFKKWGCQYWISLRDDRVSYLRGIGDAFEASNVKFNFSSNENTLVDKRIGAVFGTQEFLTSDNEVKETIKVFYLRSVQEVMEGVEAPKPRKLKNSLKNLVESSEAIYDDSNFPF